LRHTLSGCECKPDAERSAIARSLIEGRSHQKDERRFMFSQKLRNTAFIAGFLLLSTPVWAQTDLGPVTVGAGLQTSFAHTAPRNSDTTDQLILNSVRLYVNGNAAKNIKFMFNTEYDGGTNKVGILDAVARIELSPKFNIWAGRFLPPSDRANLYGPYYAHHWNVYSDGIQDGYPFIFQGRDNGVAYWGDFGKLKVSGGGFDGGSATGNKNVIGAARIQIDLWDPEKGYYLNGTYYGGKNLFAIGAAVQAQSVTGQPVNKATTADLLIERKLPDGSVITFESEFANYDRLGGYNSHYTSDKGAYALASYLFPKPVGPGKFELLGKYAQARFSRGVTKADIPFDQKTTEFNFNYVIKDFNARIMSFYQKTNFTSVNTNNWRIGVGLQVQM
jgi:hypothetical protein